MRPAAVDSRHTFGGEPQWVLLPKGFWPLCDGCGQPADHPHDLAAPTAPVFKQERAEPRRYYGD